MSVALLDLVPQVTPGFEIGPVLYRSRASLVVAGELAGVPVVAKVRTPAFQEHCRREIEAYHLFERDPPPMRVPRLLAADESRGLLVLEHLSGRCVAPDRFPATPVSATDVTGVLDVVGRLRAWRPPVGDDWQVRYEPLIERARAQGLFDPADWAAVQILVEQAGDRRELGHGDLVLANVLRTDQGYALIDWASSGLYLPGFDLAQLWMLLGEVPGARPAVEAAVSGAGDRALPAFLANLTLLLYRELRAHREPADDVARDRQAWLAESWRAVRERVHRCAATLTIC